MILPKVSVILATRNGAQHLGEAIASVLGQKFRDFEIVVIDDASADLEVEKIIKSFMDGRIRYHKNEKNLGYTAASNVGLDLARGEYVARIDDDDVWLNENKLSEQVEFLDAHPDYVVVGTNAVIVARTDERELERTDFPTDDAEIRKIILNFNPLVHCSVLFRREAVLQAGGYDAVNFPFVQDYDLWLRLAGCGKIANLPEIMVKRRARTLREEKGRQKIYKEWLCIKATWRYRKLYPGFWKATAGRILRILRGVLWYAASRRF